LEAVRVIASSGGPHRIVFLVIVLLYATIDLAVLVRAIRRGRVWTTLIFAWLTSTIPMYALGRFMEHRWLPGWAHQSWAFLFGDAIFLPLALAATALAWRQLPTKSWHRSWWWLAISIIVGVAISAKFHHDEAGVYPPLQLQSPTKLFHDLVAYPVFVAALWATAWPVVTSHLWKSRWVLPALIVFGLLMWGACSWGDTLHQLSGLHIGWDWRSLRPVPRP
jgi:hypothetical protein